MYPDVPNSDGSYSSSVVGSPDVDGSPSIGFFNIGNHDFFFSAAIFNLNAEKVFLMPHSHLFCFLN